MHLPRILGRSAPTTANRPNWLIGNDQTLQLPSPQCQHRRQLLSQHLLGLLRLVLGLGLTDTQHRPQAVTYRLRHLGCDERIVLGKMLATLRVTDQHPLPTKLTRSEER